MASHQYCDAVTIVADRFNYIDTGNIQERVAKRFVEWIPRGEAAKEGCLKAQWPAKEAKLKSAIQGILSQQTMYEDLDRLVSFTIAGTMREDGRGLCCLIDVMASNESTVPVSGFTLSAHPTEDRAVTATIGTLDSALQPGETRKITGFFGRLQDYNFMQGGNIPVVPLHATSIELADGRSVDLADWRNKYPEYLFNEQVIALEKRLSAENPFK